MEPDPYIEAEQLPFTRAEVLAAARDRLDEASARALADALAAAGREVAAARAQWPPPPASSARAATAAAPLHATAVPIPFLVHPDWLPPAIAALSPAHAERVRRFEERRRARHAPSPRRPGAPGGQDE